MERREITLHGKHITYRIAGEGPPLVLIHGITRSSQTWDAVAPVLAEHYTVIAPDLLGHGGSAKPEGDYSMGAHASGVRDLLGALGYESVSIAGHSLGGGIAMQFAYQFPERCDRLILVDSGGLGRSVMILLRMATLPGSDYVLPYISPPFLRDAGDALARVAGRLGMRASSNVEEIWNGYTSLADADARRSFLLTLRANVNLAGQRVSALDRLYLAEEMPTLIVWGSDDPIIPVGHGYRAHGEIPGSRLEIFDGAKHFPHRKDPERFARVVTEFMESTEPVEIDDDRWRERLLTGAA